MDQLKAKCPKKELKPDKKNYYIIDTDVFVSCPEIITKIDTKYPVILSEKIVNEFDDAGKLNVGIDKSNQKVAKAI